MTIEQKREKWGWLKTKEREQKDIWVKMSLETKVKLAMQIKLTTSKQSSLQCGQS